MSEYIVETENYNGIQVTNNEKSFLEIFTAKILDPKSHIAEIQSEEKRLIQEANARRQGEIAQVVFRPALPQPESQPKQTVSQSTPQVQSHRTITMQKDTEEEEEDEMNVDEPVAVPSASGPASESTGRIRKKRRVGEEESEEAEITYYFPKDGVVGSPQPWFAGTAADSAKYPLKNFALDGSGFNFIKAKLRVPEGSKGWAFNITPLSDIYSTNIYFHFNPRYKKEKIYMNHKYGTWGDELRIPAGKHYESNDIKANDIMLTIYFHKDGFLVFANDIFTAFFANRNPSRAMENDLQIVFPCEDANGKRYEVRVDQVWWGTADNMNDIVNPEIELLIEASKTARDELPNMQSPMAPRTVIIRNMPVSNDLTDLQDVEFFITDYLEENIGKEEMGAISISLVRSGSFGYARFASPEMAARAVGVISTIRIDDDERGMSFHLQASLINEGEVGHEIDGEESS